MGYPMTYRRVLARNSLGGNYTHVREYNSSLSAETGAAVDQHLHMIAGDLRRLEQDALQPGTWRTELAQRAGVDEETLIRVLTAFWDGPLPQVSPHDD